MIYFRARQKQRVDQLTNPPSCFSKLFSEHTASTMLGHAAGTALTSGESVRATQMDMSPIMGVSYSRVTFFWGDRVTGTSGLAQQHILARTYVFKPNIFEVFCKHIERWGFHPIRCGRQLNKGCPVNPEVRDQWHRPLCPQLENLLYSSAVCTVGVSWMLSRGNDLG